MELNLKLGGTYKSRNGMIGEVIKITKGGLYPCLIKYEDGGLMTTTLSGKIWDSKHILHPLDLVGEVGDTEGNDVINALKKRLNNEIENAESAGLRNIGNLGYLDAIKDVLNLIEKLERGNE